VDAPSRIAVVTGAGSGIGRAVALGLLEHGYTVALAGRRAERLQATADASGAGGERAVVVATDVADSASVRRLFEIVRNRFGRLDLLFNNAGVAAQRMPIEVIPIDTWRAALDTNVTGAFLCTQQAVALMKVQQPRGGRIINNGSLAAHVPRPLSAPYAVTKHAITGLTKITALDGRAFDIACGQIDIGNAATDMTAAYAAGALQPSGETIVEPFIDVRHVVDAVLYMAGLPLDANVPFLTVMANKMPFLGRG
jgi:NAD(P)-dependent dehydrogenase (short-subunit alcohol dehydrogenase family)